MYKYNIILADQIHKVVDIVKNVEHSRGKVYTHSVLKGAWVALETVNEVSVYSDYQALWLAHRLACDLINRSRRAIQARFSWNINIFYNLLFIPCIGSLQDHLEVIFRCSVENISEKRI